VQSYISTAFPGNSIIGCYESFADTKKVGRSPIMGQILDNIADIECINPLLMKVESISKGG